MNSWAEEVKADRQVDRMHEACIVRQWEVAVWRLCFNTPHTPTTRFISMRAAAAPNVSRDRIHLYIAHDL